MNVSTFRLQYLKKLSKEQSAQITSLHAQTIALTDQVSTQEEHIVRLEAYIAELEAQQRVSAVANQSSSHKTTVPALWTTVGGSAFRQGESVGEQPPLSLISERLSKHVGMAATRISIREPPFSDKQTSSSLNQQHAQRGNHPAPPAHSTFVVADRSGDNGIADIIAALGDAFKLPTGDPLSNEQIAEVIITHSGQLGQLAKEGTLTYQQIAQLKAYAELNIPRRNNSNTSFSTSTPPGSASVADQHASATATTLRGVIKTVALPTVPSHGGQNDQRCTPANATASGSDKSVPPTLSTGFSRKRKPEENVRVSSPRAKLPAWAARNARVALEREAVSPCDGTRQGIGYKLPTASSSTARNLNSGTMKTTVSVSPPLPPSPREASSSPSLPMKRSRSPSLHIYVGEAMTQPSTPRAPASSSAASRVEPSLQVPSPRADSSDDSSDPRTYSASRQQHQQYARWRASKPGGYFPFSARRAT